jgi:hypothetical protein
MNKDLQTSVADTNISVAFNNGNPLQHIQNR